MNYVLIYCYDRHDDFILIRKSRPPKQAGHLNLPGGKIEPGETPKEAAARELFEETGVENTYYFREVGRMHGSVCMDYGDTWNIHIFSCYYDGIEKELKSTDEEVFWADMDIIHDESLMSNLRVVLPLLQHGVEGWDIEDTDDCLKITFPGTK